jgi:hypothetical protein
MSSVLPDQINKVFVCPATVFKNKSLRLNAARRSLASMLIHSVYFWLKPGLSSVQRAKFRDGLDSLAGMASVDKIYIGTPAATDKRPVVDDSYSFALTVLLKDIAAHDAYQADPIHLAFVASCKDLWTRVQIYDAA